MLSGTSITLQAQTVSKQIIVDQFGWRAAARKHVIFADPVSGQNGSISYTPGGQFQVRRKSDNTVVFSGNVTAWNAGNTHGDSGDKVWHGDFSGLTTPGTYYIVDPSNSLRSYDFDIKADVYAPVLRTSVRTFYYQRSGTDIPATFGGNWTHPAAHGQDANAQLYTTSAQGGTNLDVRGGWYDAGDYNKYVPFLSGTLWDLMVAYELRPTAFPDNTNIPESGNSIPDLLDELKWEFDWLLKMQAGSGGVHNRVAVTSYDNGTDNPATDTQPRYYTNITTWATATFAALTAHAARLYQNTNPAYATTLRTASERAWAYLESTPAMNPASGTDGASLAAADAGSNGNADKRLRIYAAAELFRTTGTAKYKTYFEANYKDVGGTSENGFHPFSNGHLDASLCWDLNRAYFVYSQTPNATASIVGELKSRFLNVMDWFIEPYFTSRNDPYLGFMWNGHYSWGSNLQKMKWAQLSILSAELGVNTAKTALYKEIAEEYLHYIHGRNPLNWVYLSNMGAKGANAGAENSVMEIYHSWYRDGSARYDGANSQFGPAPGFLAGGPNQYYSGTTAPPKGEPPMKVYRDWNTSWPDASWEVTEPAIYYQAGYTFVVAYFTENGGSQPNVTASSNSPVCTGQTLNLTASGGGTGAAYAWKGPNGFTSTQQNPAIANAGATAAGSYTVTITPAGGTAQTATTSVTINPVPTATASSNSPIPAGQTLNLTAANAGAGATYSWSGPNSFTSSVQNPSLAGVTPAAAGTYTLTVGLNGCTKTATTAVTVNGTAPATAMIYDDALNANWVDWSWNTTRNLANSTPVYSGTKSLSAKYDAGWAGLYLHANTAVGLSGFTHLKFWVHGGTNTGQQIQVILNGGGPSYRFTTTANQWKLITVPLSTFGNPATLTDIFFQEATGSARPVCYFDRIYLANSATAREGVSAEVAAFQPEVSVYPNPVDNGRSQVTLKFSGFGADEAVQTTLTDGQGRSLLRQNFKLNSPEKQLSVPKLSPGLYYLKVDGETSQQVKKLLVR
ncbi:glycoside hydrolase family 9 protein [Larkinella soli]|uniref:glycoside hydrolase family 9 protein n=1 Tax=Larkinella soli TaxID=1770527 RepID=UPI0013E406B2|nr:glycoside hydrolase family 9 protein [Larkinella soli]